MKNRIVFLYKTHAAMAVLGWLMMFAVGCSDKGGNGANTNGVNCIPGTVSCVCEDGVRCGPELSCLTDGQCHATGEGGCKLGLAGCACLDGGCIGDGVICTADLCQASDCALGEAGCACLPEEQCSGALMCVSGTCAEMACLPGSTGCTCEGGSACLAEGDTCVQGMCRSDDCGPGSEGCGCLAGSCDPGLTCQSDICLDNTGFLGGPCLDGLRCYPGGRCQDNGCQPCRLGSLDCACDASGNSACSDGLVCYEGQCTTEAQASPPPSNPKCYTPCQQSFEEQGEWRVCEADGNMLGCIQGRICVDGTCARTEDEQPRICRTQGDCPSFQACMQGRCYSNCDSNVECGAGRVCQERVCRRVCDKGTPCPDGLSCDSDDGVSGVCYHRQADAGAGESQFEVPGTLKFSRGTTIEINGADDIVLKATEPILEFSNTNTSERFTIVNDSPRSQRIVVRKLRHRIVGETGDPQTISVADSDSDGVGDDDNCRFVANPYQLNADGDELGDACDPDDDNDTIDDTQDNCPFVSNLEQSDRDQNGIGDSCEGDEDGDGEPNDSDNCPTVPNPAQDDVCTPEGGFACDPAVNCPLAWLAMAPDAISNPEEDLVQVFEKELGPYEKLSIEVANAGGGAGSWQGALQILSTDLNSIVVRMSYNERPEGAWIGEIHYFASFGTSGSRIGWRLITPAVPIIAIGVAAKTTTAWRGLWATL